MYLKKINLYVECIIEELSPELVLQELLSADNANYIVLISFESKAKDLLSIVFLGKAAPAVTTQL